MANTLLDLFEKNPQLLEWRDKVTLLSRQLVMGFSGSSKAVVMASALSEQVPKILIVTSTQNEAEQLTGDLSAILGEDKVYSFFTDDVVAAEFIFASPEKTHSRLESLNFLMDKESSGILVTSLVGTKLHLPNPEVYKDSRIDLTLGEEHDLEALSKHLTHIGYQRVEQVLLPGEFSRRGDILDIYELTAELPYRLEFFGDEIDGIRQFDSDSQKSLDNLEHIIVSPADDIILTREDYQRAEKALESAAELKPDLILMTGEQEDLYEELSEIAPTVGYQINTDENWDYHETSLKVAEIFDKRDEMKKDLDRLDAREAVFAENVKAKFGNQKLMYLRVTDNDIRYYAYGHFGYLYDTYHFNRAETFNPDDMFQVIDPDKLKDINPDLLIVQADSQELLDNKLKNSPVWTSLKAVQNNKVIYADYSTYMLGFGIVSQEAIMKQISDEWGLN